MSRTKKEVVVTTEEERSILRNKIMNDINKSLGRDVIKLGSELEEKERISWGIKELDEFTGGGIVCGNFNVIYGGNSVGKSTSLLHLVANAQKENKVCLYLDLEQSFSIERAVKFGIDLNKLYLVQDCNTAEQSMDIIKKLCKDKLVDLIIVDSIQSFSPKLEQETSTGKEKSIEDDSMALLARKLSQFFRMTAPYIAQGKVAIVLVAQCRVQGIGSFIVSDGLSGGHCYDENTSIITIDGFKKLNEIKIGDIIPTVNLNTNYIEYKPIKNIFKFNNINKVIKFENKYNHNFIFSDEHNCLVKQYFDGKLSKDIYKIIKAKDKRRTYAFPICFSSGNKEYNINDEELRFLGWLCTDSTIQVQNGNTWHNGKKIYSKITIYQTKHIERIKTILNNLDIKYSLTERIRKDNREEFKNTKISYEFNILDPNYYINKYNLNSEKILPKLVTLLSDRQFNILLYEMMLADGCFKRSRYSYIAKGNLTWIKYLAYQCITHNVPISGFVKDKNKKCYYLHFRQSNYHGFLYNQKSIVDYKGIMWCIEVDNAIHFIEREGTIIATHNSIKHWASYILYFRRGQKAESPIEKIKEKYIDEDDKERSRTIDKIIGFDCVIKMEKTKVSGTSRENTDIHIPFYYETGFIKGTK